MNEEEGEEAKNESANGDKPAVKNNGTTAHGSKGLYVQTDRQGERDKEQEEGEGEGEGE